MELVSVPAVVVDVSTVRDKDQLITFLTRNHGKVRLYARRISRHRPARTFFETLQGGELTYVKTNENAPGRLFSFAAQRVWPGIRGDFWRIMQSLAFLELVNICATEGESQHELFDLFIRFLDQLEQDKLPGNTRLIATLRLLRIVGFDPHLERCLACLKAPDSKMPLVLSPGGGGILCRPCAAEHKENALPLSHGAHRFMLRALSLKEDKVYRLRAGKAIAREISRHLEIFLEVRLEAKLLAVPYLDKIWKNWMNVQ